MQRFNVSNEKGGVGKTTLAVTVASGLAAHQRRVLVIDADAQGHATRALGVPKYPGLYDLLVRSADWQDVLKPALPSFWGLGLPEGQTEYDPSAYRLWVLGSNVETSNIANSMSDAWRLCDRLDEIADRFDAVVIETAPTPSLLHGVITLASDYLIYPTQAEMLSADGLMSSLTHRQSFAALRHVVIAGIVPMMVRPQTWEHAQMLTALRRTYGELMWPEITESIVWAEASRAMLAVFAYRPDHPAAAQALALVSRVEALLI